jgi:hypothetical protein
VRPLPLEPAAAILITGRATHPIAASAAFILPIVTGVVRDGSLKAGINAQHPMQTSPIWGRKKSPACGMCSDATRYYNLINY